MSEIEKQDEKTLTPVYVAQLMVDMLEINMKSYVWDGSVGASVFLDVAKDKMIKEAYQLTPKKKRNKQIKSILTQQLKGIDKPDDQRNYEIRTDDDFSATHFLLNPPYSAEGKGLIFAEQAMACMTAGGKAAVLIQENAGSGQGNPVAKRLLEKHRLVASIHMADIFRGKASVRTAIYMFEVGVPHNEMHVVKFIDMDNDGYTRSNRKKSDAKTNLKDTDNAVERYKEVANLVKYGAGALNLYSNEHYVEDTIGLEGDDWTFAKHRVIDTEAKEEDFLKTIGDYLQFRLDSSLSQVKEEYAKEQEERRRLQQEEKKKIEMERERQKQLEREQFTFSPHPTGKHILPLKKLVSRLPKEPQPDWAFMDRYISQGQMLLMQQHIKALDRLKAGMA